MDVFHRGKKRPEGVGSRRVLHALRAAILKSGPVQKDAADVDEMGMKFLQESSTVVENGLTKSALDGRVYKLITLPNELQVLLIHDERVILSGAALNVNGM